MKRFSVITTQEAIIAISPEGVSNGDLRVANRKTGVNVGLRETCFKDARIY